MDRSRKSWEAQGRGAELPQAQVFDDWQACDGFVKDVDTALLALALSSLVSLLLLVFVERIKLLFYQSAENAYEAATDFNPNDKSKYLQTRNLTKTYAGNVEAVKGISFDVNSNKEILGLLGANGAGKSSTFNMVTMQIKRTSGDVFIFNQSIHDIKYLSDVNITAQADILWPYLSIKEHCQIIALISGQPEFERRFAELAKLLELDAEYKVASILSGGNRRKLCTALTLLTVPKLAYFDEPTVGLDPVARRNLLNLIKRSNASVLFTTHRLDEAEYLCSRVAIMQLGKILFDGNIEDIKIQTQEGTNGLILVKRPSIDLMEQFTYLQLDHADIDQSLFKIAAGTAALSQIFKDLLDQKNQGHIEDFSYFEPSLHHAFVALSGSSKAPADPKGE